MNLQKTAKGTVLTVYVKPNSRRFQMKTKEDELIVFCQETPVRGKVNRELIRELSRLFKKKVEIVSGLGSRQKKVLINDIGVEAVNKILSAYRSE